MRFFKYFSIGFIISFGLTFLVSLFFVPVKLGLILAGIFAALYGLFSLGFMVRTLKTVTFEINMKNKDPKKGLSWYQDEIEGIMKPFAFYVEKKQNQKIYHPARLYGVFESPIIFTYEPYSIQIESSRMFMRIFLDAVDLTPKD